MHERSTSTKGAGISTEGVLLNSDIKLSDRAISDIVKSCLAMEIEKPHGLGGRGATLSREISDLGNVRIKAYSRGGVWRRFIAQHFLKFGETRSEGEFNALKRARELGVAAPEPIAYAHKGALFYRAWLITEEIPKAKSLAELSLENEGLARTVTENVADQIWRLIDGKFVHIDFHPGNVLISDQNTPFIIDFDKAVEFNGSKEELRDFYIRRWRRAVIKHKLPDYLVEIFSLKLRKKVNS